MNKKTLKLILIGILFSINLIAQSTDFYFTSENNKVILSKSVEKYLVEFPNGLNVSKLTDPSNFPGIKVTDKTYFITDLNLLSKYSDAYNVTPTYVTADGLELNYTRDILLKFKQTTSAASKAKIIAEKKLLLIKSTVSYDMYQTSEDALQVSKYLYLTGQVEFCTPDFISKVDKLDYIPNDTYFDRQWYLQNTGQGTNDGKTTTVDADIDAPEAWDITRGNANVIVAIVDEGVTSNHPDLPNTKQVRLSGSNFAYLFDGTNNPDDPSPTISSSNGNNHGNSCAGIVGATQDNNEGISGIAPLCKIMPIKIPFNGVFPASIYADAINFAVANNADIISNSWGINSSDPNFQPVILAAINNAINNNKIVVFATGNSANRVAGVNGFVYFPANANITNLITVGASDRNNNQANYSPNGSSLEIVAPSQTAANWQIVGEAGNIWTIDIPSSNYGYNSWRDDAGGLPAIGEILPNSGTNFASYTGRMGGTSASTPMIAGVLALMKAVNSCLNVSQMKDILQSTADKIGGFNYNWNPSLPGHSLELGFGKVNAYKAVQMAQSMVGYAQISGLDAICTSATYSSAGGATTYNWTITQGANLVTIAGNGTSTVTLTAQPNVSGQVTLSLTLGGTCGDVTTNKTITVGVPQFNSFTFGNEFLIPACFSVSCLTTGLQSSVINASFTGMSASEIMDNSNWEWERNNDLIFLNSLVNRTQVCPIAIGSSSFKVRAKNACGWSDWVDYQLFDITECPFNFRTSATIYTIYPNPSKDIVNIELKDSKIKPEKEAIVSGTLFDLMGQSRGKVQIKNNSASLSVAGLKKGIYVLNINIDGKVEGHQVIVE